MKPLESVQEFVLKLADQGEVSSISLSEALGLISAVEIRAPHPVPSFVTSSVDGFAVSSDDLSDATSESVASLRILDSIASAGADLDSEITAGVAQRIMTGARVSSGADAIVMVEDASESEATVSFREPATPGQYMRPVGSDIELGQTLVQVGDVLTPARLGALATVGTKVTECFRVPSVGVISTGNELVEFTDEIVGSQIRDINRLTLISTLKQLGVPARDYGIVEDSPDAIRAVLDKASDECDIVITTGAVSMGALDFIKALALETESLSWFQVAIKPAKPLVAGSYGKAVLFGLPGNPVSCLVSFTLFVEPLIRKMRGQQMTVNSYREALTDRDLVKPDDGKVHFMRGRSYEQDGLVKVEPYTGQQSHQIAEFSKSNCLIRVCKPGVSKSGSRVSILQIGSSGNNL